MSVILRKKLVLKEDKMEMVWERRRKEKGKRGMRREKGEKELVWVFFVFDG